MPLLSPDLATGNKMKIILHTLFLLFLSHHTLGFSNPLSETDVLGAWVNQAGDGIIEIKQHDGHYIGIIAGSTDGKDRKDVNNSDPERQAKSLLHVKVMDEFVYAGDLTWEDGWIYDPNNGNTYSCKMTLIDQKTLKIRGYIGITLFGRTEIWTRYQPSETTDNTPR
jgi:uncharacterized protein (DUF2147 family)